MEEGLIETDWALQSQHLAHLIHSFADQNWKRRDSAPEHLEFAAFGSQSLSATGEKEFAC
jgi:hypothetical protein